MKEPYRKGEQRASDEYLRNRRTPGLAPETGISFPASLCRTRLPDPDRARWAQFDRSGRAQL